MGLLRSIAWGAVEVAATAYRDRIEAAAGALPATAEEEPRVPTRQERGDELVVVRRRDYTSTGGSAGLTPSRLAAILLEANAGNIRRFVDLCTEIEEKDLHIGGVLQTRKLAVVGKPWEIVEPAESVDQRIDVAVREMLKDIPSFPDRLLDLLDALAKGFAVLEIIWASGTGKEQVRDLKWRPQSRFRYVLSQPDIPVGEVRLLTDAEPIWGERLWSDKFIIHQPRSRSGFPTRAGLGRGLAIAYLLKGMTQQGWAIFCEVFGQPLRLGRVKAGAPPEEKAVLREALKSLGTDAYGILSGESEVLFPEPTGRKSSADLYERRMDWLDRAISKAILGHAGSADSTPGRLGAEGEASGIRQDLVQADARALEATIRRDLIAPFVRFRFGSSARVPVFRVKVDPPTDLQAEAARVKTLREAGLAIPAAWVYEIQGIPAPIKGEDTLQAPTPAPGAFGVPGGGDGTLPFLPAPRRGDRVDLASRKKEEALISAFFRQNEALFNAARKAGPGAWAKYLAPIREAFLREDSLDGLRRHILALNLPDEAITPLLMETQLAGHVLGRAQVGAELELLTQPIGLKLQPMRADEALKWLQARMPVDIEAFNAAAAAIKTRTFSLARHEGKDTILAVRRLIEEAIEEGTPYKKFCRNYTEMMGRLGRTATDDFHLETVFRNGVQSSLNVGRYKQQSDPDVIRLRPYWQYRTVGDDSVRDAHRALADLVYPARHPFWHEYYPPNGHRCRCSVSTLSQRQVDQRKLTVHETIPEDLPRPDKGWEANPGEAPTTI